MQEGRQDYWVSERGWTATGISCLQGLVAGRHQQLACSLERARAHERCPPDARAEVRHIGAELLRVVAAPRRRLLRQVLKGLAGTPLLARMRAAPGGLLVRPPAAAARLPDLYVMQARVGEKAGTHVLQTQGQVPLQRRSALQLRRVELLLRGQASLWQRRLLQLRLRLRRGRCRGRH